MIPPHLFYQIYLSFLEQNDCTSPKCGELSEYTDSAHTEVEGLSSRCMNGSNVYDQCGHDIRIQYRSGRRRIVLFNNALLFYGYMESDWRMLYKSILSRCGRYVCLFSVPTSGPQLVYQRPWYVLFCLWKSAYKRSLAAYRKEQPMWRQRVSF